MQVQVAEVGLPRGGPLLGRPGDGSRQQGCDDYRRPEEVISHGHAP
jgi:hypothetical protein